jgi:hypothetical protein
MIEDEPLDPLINGDQIGALVLVSFSDETTGSIYDCYGIVTKVYNDYCDVWLETAFMRCQSDVLNVQKETITWLRIGSKEDNIN